VSLSYGNGERKYTQRQTEKMSATAFFVSLSCQRIKLNRQRIIGVFRLNLLQTLNAFISIFIRMNLIYDEKRYLQFAGSIDVMRGIMTSDPKILCQCM